MKENTPDIWGNKLPQPKETDHKYSRGQVVVLGGMDMTGAACLSADAAARGGAGMVTIISPYLSVWQGLSMLDPLLVYKTFRPYIIARNDITLHKFIAQNKHKGCIVPVVGPGLGDKEYKTVRDIVISLLKLKIPMVLDADGLNAFEGHQDMLWRYMHKNAVLTPHEGEFKRLFPDISVETAKDREVALEKALHRCPATLVLKGSGTIIAAENTEFVTNNCASPYLATAGSGDVLSGMIASFIAQGMPVFDGTCAAVWMHGKTANTKGVGLVASDLIEIIPKTLKETLGICKKVG